LLRPGLELTMGQSGKKDGNQETSKNSMHARSSPLENLGSGTEIMQVKAELLNWKRFLRLRW
ncbi:MAG TPA: hypothetical protein VG488_13450, partial [Candidatus Angelobacter sp.]|nr:hypothetical protein [Candidatus Angelobacter sp.]